MRDDTEDKSSLCNKVGLVLLITLMRVAYFFNFLIFNFLYKKTLCKYCKDIHIA